MFLLNATKSCLTLKAGEMLVAGSVNVHEVKFEFSDDWSELVKTVTFRTVSDSRSVILNEEGECIIPWEVLKDSSPYLYVGLIGTRDAEVVLPTIWADLGEVRNGTEPGADVTDPTPTVYEQVLSELGSRANNLNVKDEKLQLRSGETVLSEVELPKQEAAEPGTTDHTALLNRDAPDQHPIKSITGLEEALKEAGADSWEDIGTKQAFEPIEFNWVYIDSYDKIDISTVIGIEATAYKIADNVPPCTLDGAVFYGLGESIKLEAVNSDALPSSEKLYYVAGSPNPDSEAGDPSFTLYIIEDGAGLFGLPAVYVYFESGYAGEFPFTISRETITPLPEQYLPTTVPVIQTAQVGQTIVVKAVDESGKPTEWEAAELPEQVQGDWNVNDESDPAFVKNRTHWMERPFEPIVWDGSTESRDSIDVSAMYGYPAGSVFVYKVSDKVFSSEQLIAARCFTAYQGEQIQGEISEPIQVIDGSVWAYEYASMRYTPSGYEDFCSGTIVVTAISGDFSTSFGVVIPSVGTYAIQNSNIGVTPHTVEINSDVYHKISPSFLPNNNNVIPLIYPCDEWNPLVLKLDAESFYDTDISGSNFYDDEFRSAFEASGYVGNVFLSIHDSSAYMATIQFFKRDSYYFGTTVFPYWPDTEVKPLAFYAVSVGFDSSEFGGFYARIDTL